MGIWNRGKKYGTHSDSNRFIRASVSIRRAGQIKTPPLILSCTKTKIGWKCLGTDRHKIVRSWRSLTLMGAIRKYERMWRTTGV